MARYTVRWVIYAEQQRDDLPAPARDALDVVLDVLTADPTAPGSYDKSHDQWTATFGDFGLIIYTIEERWITITVLRVLWTG